jgi:putative transposase
MPSPAEIQGQNGTTESFNGKFRDECPSLEWFRSRAEAKVLIETWRRQFNEVRRPRETGPRLMLVFRRISEEGSSR